MKILFFVLFPFLALSQVISPEQYGAVGANKTLAQNGYTQAMVDSAYPGLGMTTADQCDVAAWQKTINQKSKIIISKKIKYYFNKGIYYDVFPSFYILADSINWYSTNTATFTFLSRKTKPKTKAEAEAMTVRTPMTIIGLVVHCQPGQSAFDMNCLTNLTMRNNRINGAKNGIKADFCMRSDISMNHCEGCNNGFMQGLAIDGVIELSCNEIRMNQNECHACIDTAFAVQYSYEQQFQQNSAEGSNVIKIGLFINYTNKTTANSETFDSFHFEHTSASIAATKCLLRHQKIEFRDFNFQGTGIAFDCQELSDNGGGAGVIINRLTGASGLNGKLLRSNNMTWRFMFTDAITSTDHVGKWATDLGGVVPQMGARTAVGYNSYLFNSLEW